MNYRDYFAGIISSLSILLLVILTFLFSKQLVEYSGIATFYSLLIVIFLFILKERIDYEKRIIAKKNFLRNLLILTELLQKDVEEYNKILLQDEWFPHYSLSYLDVDMIPVFVDKKSTRKLTELVFNANNEIDVLVEKRRELSDIFKDPKITEKVRQKCIEDYLHYSKEYISKAISNLKNLLESIKRELKKWDVY